MTTACRQTTCGGGNSRPAGKPARLGIRYDEEALGRLTWNNLGYRLGLVLGAQAVQDIDWVFTVLAKRCGGPLS